MRTCLFCPETFTATGSCSHKRVCGKPECLKLLRRKNWAAYRASWTPEEHEQRKARYRKYYVENRQRINARTKAYYHGKPVGERSKYPKDPAERSRFHAREWYHRQLLAAAREEAGGSKLVHEVLQRMGAPEDMVARHRRRERIRASVGGA